MNAQLEKTWSTSLSPLKALIRASAAYRQGERQSATHLLAGISPLIRLHPARGVKVRILEGDIDGALDFLEEQLAASENIAMVVARGTKPDRVMFPDFYGHPRYREVLAASGLDDESVGKLVVPPL